MRNVGILVYDDVEVLDFAGPFQVFTTAQRVARPGTPFATFTVAQNADVLARGGLAVEPTYTFGLEPRIDVLVVPGGVVTAELGKPEVIEWIAARAAEAELVVSVCTGVFLLAKAGLLAGKTITTHWEDIDDFRKSFPRHRGRRGVALRRRGKDRDVGGHLGRHRHEPASRRAARGRAARAPHGAADGLPLAAGALDTRALGRFDRGLLNTSCFLTEPCP